LAVRIGCCWSIRERNSLFVNDILILYRAFITELSALY